VSSTRVAAIERPRSELCALPNLTLAEAQERFDDLRAELKAAAGRSVSIGYAELRDGDLTDLVKRADTAPCLPHGETVLRKAANCGTATARGRAWTGNVRPHVTRSIGPGTKTNCNLLHKRSR